ncbi:hypothetical protein HV390_11570 [Enterococcus faecium]|nr:hypothetical protein [Enterococcus faecium]
MTSKKKKATAAKQQPANYCSFAASLWLFHTIQNKKGSVKMAQKTTTATAVEEKKKKGFGQQKLPA